MLRLRLKAKEKLPEPLTINTMKPTHGGKRSGAGRKPGNPRQSLSIRISQPAIAKLHELRETTGTSAGRLIESMILNQQTP